MFHLESLEKVFYIAVIKPDFINFRELVSKFKTYILKGEFEGNDKENLDRLTNIRDTSPTHLFSLLPVFS